MTLAGRIITKIVGMRDLQVGRCFGVTESLGFGVMQKLIFMHQGVGNLLFLEMRIPCFVTL